MSHIPPLFGKLNLNYTFKKSREEKRVHEKLYAQSKEGRSYQTLATIPEGET